MSILVLLLLLFVGSKPVWLQWVMNNKLGCVIEPSVNDLVKYFFAVERK